MAALYFLSALAFVALGIYGAICAYHRWWRSETGFVIFEPLGGAYYVNALALTLFGAFAGFHTLDGAALLVEIALFPFGVLGTVLFLMGFALECGSRLMGNNNSGTVARTFDRGDGLMAQNQFAAAEQEYRRALQEEPDNVEALLRLGRALEGQHEFELAAQELSAAHRKLVIRRNDPAPACENWQPKLLSVTYALGDLYVGKLNDPERAQRLYQTTLELLFGYRDANPLRERLKRLDRAAVPRQPTEQAVPERLSLED